MPVHLTCCTCGVSFTRKPAEVYARNYCSNACRHAIAPSDPVTFIEGGTAALIALRARDGSVRAHTIVDATDVEWVNQHRWSLSHHGYAVRLETVNGRGRIVRLHRLMVGLGHDDRRTPDHINRDRLDNRRANLRIVPREANSQNVRGRGGTSQYRNVFWSKVMGKWGVTLRHHGRYETIGYYTDEHEAGAVAKEARRRLMPYAVD